MTKESLDNWNDFIGSQFLKTDHVPSDKEGFIVESIEIYEDEDKNRKPRLTLVREEEHYLFDLNVTNANFCRNEGKITAPIQLLGKKLFFKKVNVINPKTKKEVESLRISRIE